MEDSIQIIDDDDDNLILLGNPGTIDEFLHEQGMASSVTDITPHRGKGYLAGAVVQTWGDLSAQSGRWVKLTKESADGIRKFGLMKDSKTGLSMGTIWAKGRGGIKGAVRFEQGVGTKLNPAVLTNVGALLTQAELQKSMEEITKYLEKIDEKVDDILRAQKDAILSNMIGANLVIEDAMSVRNQVGYVSQTSWDKVQSTSLVTAQTEAYALRQLDAIAEKIEKHAKVQDLATDLPTYRKQIDEWIAVLARCLQLQDASTILELDRIAQSAPEELNEHRKAIKITRKHRMDVITQTAIELLDRIRIAGESANQQVLLHPKASPQTVNGCNLIRADVTDFGKSLGLVEAEDSLPSRPWLDAARDTTAKVLDASKGGVDTAKDLGIQLADRTREVGGAISQTVAAQTSELLHSREANISLPRLLRKKEEDDNQ